MLREQVCGQQQPYLALPSRPLRDEASKSHDEFIFCVQDLTIWLGPMGIDHREVRWQRSIMSIRK
jgi:hypothetical protein